MLFHEASAKSNINVEEAFLDLIRAILNKVRYSSLSGCGSL